MFEFENMDKVFNKYFVNNSNNFDSVCFWQGQ